MNYHSDFYQLYDIKLVLISIDNSAKQTKKSIKAYVLGIGEVGAFKAQMFNLAQILIRIPMLKFTTSAPILPIPC